MTENQDRPTAAANDDTAGTTPSAPPRMPLNPLANLPQPNFDVVSKSEYPQDMETRSE